MVNPMIMDGMRPLSPNFQYIGMMNCKVGEPLPKDLADFMDSGKEHGAIFVSFGTVLQAKTMNKEKLKVFIDVFGSLKQKIIWKWEDEEMPGKPKNVKLSTWLPQQDILAHPNTKLFITHAGQSSIQETLCHQKPVVEPTTMWNTVKNSYHTFFNDYMVSQVAIPLAADQPANAKEAVKVGFGVQVG